MRRCQRSFGRIQRAGIRRTVFAGRNSQDDHEALDHQLLRRPAVTADVVSQYVFGLAPIFRFPRDRQNAGQHVSVGSFCSALFRVTWAPYILGSARLHYYVYGKLNLYFIATAASDSLLLRADALLPDRLGRRASDLGRTVKCAACALVVIASVRGQRRLRFSLISFASGVPVASSPILIQGAILGCLFGQIVAPEYIVLFIVLAMARLSDGGRAQSAHVALAFI